MTRCTFIQKKKKKEKIIKIKIKEKKEERKKEKDKEEKKKKTTKIKGVVTYLCIVSSSIGRSYGLLRVICSVHLFLRIYERFL